MKDTFVFRREWMDAISGLPGEVRLDIYEAIIEYGTSGTIPTLKPMAMLAFNLVKKAIDRDRERYAEISRKRSEAGRKHRGNQYTKLEQNGTKWNKMEQNGTNGSDNDIISSDEDMIISNINIKKDCPNGQPKEIGVPPLSAEPTRRGQGIDFSAFMEFYNRTMADCAIPAIKSLSEKRRLMLGARAREHGKDALAEVVRKAAASSFLNGGGDRAFVADFDWIFRPNNFLKILEGSYDNNDTNNGQQQYQRRTVYQQQQLDNIAAAERDSLARIEAAIRRSGGVRGALPDRR